MDEKNRFFTLPNALSLSRIFLLPLVVLALIRGSTSLALTMLAFMVLTDALDGYLARALKLVSNWGRILDHVVDKTVNLTLFYTLVQLKGFPFWAFYLILVRESFTLLAGFYLYQKIKIIGESNLWGRLGGFLAAATLFSYIVELPIKIYFLYLTILLFFFASFNYGKLYLPRLRVREPSWKI